MKEKYIIHCLTVLLAGLTILITGCTGEDVNASVQAPPPSVTVSTPVTRKLTHFAEFTGTTEAFESVDIRARVEGILTRVHFTPGAQVEKGQVLYTIDPAPYRALLKEARANLAIQKADRELARATSLRREQAFKDKAVSEVAVIQARADLAAATARVESAEAAVTRAVLDMSYTRVTAPISGRIGLNRVDAGNLVGAGERTLLTAIVRDDSVYAYFTVNERDLLRYRELLGAQPSPARTGTPVFLGLANQDDRPYRGRIDYIHNRMDNTSGTIRVRGIFANPDHDLLPGLYVKIRIPLGVPREALLVPETALGRDQKGHFLLVADADNKVRYLPVATGPREGQMRVITRGLTPGDRVIVNGIQKARPGALVTVEKISGTATTASAGASA